MAHTHLHARRDPTPPTISSGPHRSTPQRARQPPTPRQHLVNLSSRLSPALSSSSLWSLLVNATPTPRACQADSADADLLPPPPSSASSPSLLPCLSLPLQVLWSTLAEPPDRQEIVPPSYFAKLLNPWRRVQEGFAGTPTSFLSPASAKSAL